MSLALAMSFVPQYAVLPSFMGLDAIAVSPRVPYDGTQAISPAAGVTGMAGTFTPPPSAVEASLNYATVALWSYTAAAPFCGYASAAAFVAEFTSRGIPIQGTTNTSPANGTTGPFMVDAAGYTYQAGNTSPRPALNSGSLEPPLSRGTTANGFAPANSRVTRTEKLRLLDEDIAAGVFSIQFDDPRHVPSFIHWAGITPDYDINGQGCDFSPTAMTGFTAWLEANTTPEERTAVGLPSSTSGFDFLVWLKANKPAIMHSPNQVDGTLVDNYLFRTSVAADANLRAIFVLFGRFARDDHQQYIQAMKTRMAGRPMSHNFYMGTPLENMSWHTRRGALATTWDFAMSEIAPPFWYDLSPHTIGSPDWLTARLDHVGMRSKILATHDMVGQRGFIEAKPTSLTEAPPRVLVQVLRQSMVDTYARGAVPVAPYENRMSTEGNGRQGVDIEGYRYWPDRKDYLDVLLFGRASGAYLVGYEKLAVVHVAVHSDSYPNDQGATQEPRFVAMSKRFAELERRDIPYWLMPVGSATGLMPTDPVRSVEVSAPLILRIQPDVEYFAHMGRLSGNNCRGWSISALEEAQQYSPVRSLNPYVRAIARYNAAAGRVSVHLVNYAMNTDGTPKPETTILRWNRRYGSPVSVANVVRLGEAPGTVDLSRGFGQVSVREYAIVNFAVA